MLRHFLDWGSTEIRWTDFAKNSASASAIAFCQPNYSLERLTDQAVLAVGTPAARYLHRVPKSAALYQPCLAGVPIHLGVAGRAGQAILQQQNWQEHWWQSWLSRRVLTWAVPTQITGVEQQGCEQLAKSWGYKEVKLVPAALALASFWTNGQKTESPLWILDIGAEKTEIAIVQNDAIINGQTVPFGMTALVAVVQQNIAQTHKVEVSQPVAEQLLANLGTVAAKTSPSRELNVMGRSLETQLPTVTTIKSELIQPELLTELNTLEKAIENFLAQVSAPILTETLQHGISVSGGGAQLGGLGDWLQTRYQVICHHAKRPKLVSVEGLMKRYANKLS